MNENVTDQENYHCWRELGDHKYKRDRYGSLPRAKGGIDMRGKKWSVEEERLLIKLVQEGHSYGYIAEKFKTTKSAVRMKASRLELLVVNRSSKNPRITTKQINLPQELPSMEEALKILAGALQKSAENGLSQIEIQRLRIVADLARAYKDYLGDYLDYRKTESQLLELRKLYADLRKPEKPEAQ